jgi:hypothetical protein
MLISDAELTRRLSEAVACLVPEAFGQGAQLETLSPLRMDRRYSFMFRYWVRKPDQSQCSILVKIPHQDWIHSIEEAIASDQVREEIKHEFATMQSVYSLVQNSGHPQLFAINPVGGYLSEYNAIVMEEVPLEMLKGYLTAFSIIVNDRPAWMDFEVKLRLAGEWLRLIHDAFRQDQTRRLAELDIQKTALSEIDLLEKISGRKLATVRASFVQLYELMRDWPVPISALHNDFHLGNIFVTPDGRVGALDPNWQDAGAVYEDLASLLIDPITRKLQVLLLGLAFRNSQRVRFEHAVLGGYFKNAPPPYPILYLYCAVDLLAKWRKNEEILRSKPWAVASPGSRYIGSYFQRLVASYLALGLDSATHGGTPK